MRAGEVAEKQQSPLHVLMLAFEFPPLSNGGVYRAVGLAETLPDMGIALDIVTVRETDYEAWSTGRLDHAMIGRVPATGVHRVPSGFPRSYWRLMATKAGFRVAQYAYWGDPVAVFWRRPLFDAVDKLIAARRPDVLLATAPPFGVAVLARMLARRYRLPWVVDWRDPWSLWCSAPFPSYLHYRYAQRHEHRALREANASVATSHVTREDWIRTAAKVDTDRLVTIYNGFDSHITQPAGEAPVEDRASGERTAPLCRIVYVGSFYYNRRSNDAMLQSRWRRPPKHWLFHAPRREDWRYRSPYFFLRGLRRFADLHPEEARSVRVEFAGAVPDWLPEMLEETGTTAFVVLHGPVSHSRSLALQRAATAVLLTSAKVIGGRDYSIAGKLYEYFGLRKPILGVLTDGAMRDLVEQSGLGLLADPDDPDAIAAQIGRLASGVAAGLGLVPDDVFLAQFQRQETARTMAVVLRRAATEGYRG